MAIKPELMKAILAMDSYNRGYDEGIKISGTQIGTANIISDSFILGETVIDGETVRIDSTIGFYGIAYNFPNTSTIPGFSNASTTISYRGPMM